MDKVLIAKLGLEGGGISIYGRQSDGVWTFWGEGDSIALDENDDEDWRFWTTDPAPSLDLVLPKDWPWLIPMEIHPDFRACFRAIYEKARSRLRDDQRQYGDYQHRAWLEMLSE